MRGMDSSFDTLHRAIDDIPEQREDTPLRESAILGFDTETTGAAVGRDSIVSASLVLRPRGAGADHHAQTCASWLINPHRPISPGASRVNGFTDEFVALNGQEPEAALDEIGAIIAAAQRRSIPLLAYNAPFDVGMVHADLKRWKLPDVEMPLVIDPLVIDRAVSTRRGRRTLSDTTEYYGIEPDGRFHDALADTIAAIDLIPAMSELYPTVARMPLGNLMDWQRQAHERWRRSFNTWLESHGRQPIREGWL